jgi:hypothetical protein
MLAYLGEPTLTRITDAARACSGFTNDPVTHLPTFDLFPHLCDHPGKLMAQGNRRPVGMTVMIDMKVTPTDRYRLYFDKDFVILWNGLGDLPNFNQTFSSLIFDDCFHPLLTPTPRLCRKSVHGSTGSPRTEHGILKINYSAVRPELVEGRTANCEPFPRSRGRGISSW